MVNYNQLKVTKEFLKPLTRITYDIFVVDNSSENRIQLGEEFSNIKVIYSQKNGFCSRKNSLLEQV